MRRRLPIGRPGGCRKNNNKFLTRRMTRFCNDLPWPLFIMRPVETLDGNHVLPTFTLDAPGNHGFPLEVNASGGL